MRRVRGGIVAAVMIASLVVVNPGSGSIHGVPSGAITAVRGWLAHQGVPHRGARIYMRKLGAYDLAAHETGYEVCIEDHSGTFSGRNSEPDALTQVKKRRGHRWRAGPRYTVWKGCRDRGLKFVTRGP